MADSLVLRAPARKGRRASPWRRGFSPAESAGAGIAHNGLVVSSIRRWIAEVEQRPVSRRNRLGALVAILTCPCHVGVAIILLSGTAVGGWLAAQRAWLYVLFTILFVGGLLLLFRRDPADCDRCGD
jgi:MFS family permease